MNKMLEILKGARKLEWLLLIIALAVLLLMQGSGDRFFTSDSDMEGRLARILSEMNGVGRVRVMISEGEEGEPEGVLIVAEGAEDIAVCLRIQHAVHRLLGMDIARIEVAEYGG